MNPILILGGGIGGISIASLLSGKIRNQIIIVSNSDFIYSAGIPSTVIEGLDINEIVKPIENIERKNVRVIKGEVNKIDLANRKVIVNNSEISYDNLIVALGSVIPEGLHTWTLEGASKFKAELESFKGGRVLIGPESKPYKCPPAPFDIAFRLKKYFKRKGVKANIAVFHYEERPLSGLGGKVSDKLISSLNKQGIELISPIEVSEVDLGKKVLVSKKGDRINFDLIHLIPKHIPPKVIRESELSDQNGWANVKPNMRSEKYDDVFAIGDIASPHLSIPMAGFLALYEAVLVGSRIVGEEIGSKAYAICPVQMGNDSFLPFCDFTPVFRGGEVRCRVINTNEEFIVFIRDMIKSKIFSYFL
jgi:sulfide:quinone oxidoreductase